MFDFFRKRVPLAPPKAAGAEPAKKAVPNEDLSLARQSAMTLAAEFAADEPAAVAFILQCDFAEARLAAAEHVYTRHMVEQVLQAMRNTDRRVAKLMQTRLEICKQWERDEALANQCIAQAQEMIAAAMLPANQVADLDRAWQAIGPIARPQRQAFDDARAQLAARLAAQASLQRAMIDALARLKELKANIALDASEDSAHRLDALEQEVAQYSASPEAATLPKHLIHEFSSSAAELRKQLQQRAQDRVQQRAAIEARLEWLARSEAHEPASLTAADLQRAWQALPPLSDEALLAPLAARFETLMQSVASIAKPQKPAAVSDEPVMAQFAAALAAMEKLLEEGALQRAAEQDRIMRSLDAAALHLTPAQSEKLSRARAELGRLQGWARWGGNVSREELLHAAESLPAQALAAPELARKVGSLRERWKSLDLSAGPAPKELWKNFDAACTAAYAPAAAHFKQLGEERQRHATAAQAMVDELRQFVAQALAGGDAVDWRAVAGHIERARQAWRRLGAMDRKEKKRLDAEFEAVMTMLTQPLDAARATAAAEREQLIAQVKALDPHHRTTLDKLRDLQGSWQQQAKILPLERQLEQALWQKFRGACDAVFAQRKEMSLAADVERRTHLQEKEALCSRLEAALSASESAMRTLLRETRQAWESIGPVPRAAEQAVSLRFKQANDALQRQLNARQAEARAEKGAAVRSRLHLCLRLEQKLASGSLTAEEIGGFQTEWDQLPPADGTPVAALQQRWTYSLAAAKQLDQRYAAALASQRAGLLHDILRLEIVAGLDSPAEFSRERMRLQVEVLQSSLKGGRQQEEKGGIDRLLPLCRQAGALDQPAIERIERLIDHFTSHQT